MLSHKQRVIRAIQGGELDRLPTQISFTPEMSRKVARHLGVPEEKLFQKLNNHIIMVSPDDTRKIDKNKAIRYDNWGIGWDMGKLVENLLDMIVEYQIAMAKKFIELAFKKLFPSAQEKRWKKRCIILSKY